VVFFFFKFWISFFRNLPPFSKHSKHFKTVIKSVSDGHKYINPSQSTSPHASPSKIAEICPPFLHSIFIPCHFPLPLNLPNPIRTRYGLYSCWIRPMHHSLYFNQSWKFTNWTDSNRSERMDKGYLINFITI